MVIRLVIAYLDVLVKDRSGTAIVFGGPPVGTDIIPFASFVGLVGEDSISIWALETVSYRENSLNIDTFFIIH